MAKTSAVAFEDFKRPSGDCAGFILLSENLLHRPLQKGGYAALWLEDVIEITGLARNKVIIEQAG